MKPHIWEGFREEIEKYARTAPGIPDLTTTKKIRKVEEPRVVPFVIQSHQARKSGKHYDLRIADPETGDAHSWALRKLPAPGERVLAIQQPTHTIPYLNFEGIIESGYGAGTVTKHLNPPAEVLYADDNKINFNLYPGKDTKEMTLVRMKDKNWLLLNRTPTRETYPDVPQSKPKYKEKKPDQIDFQDTSKIMMAKVDGAHSSFHIRPGKPIKIYSHRPSERSTELIQHTDRVRGARETKGRKEDGETILRGELWAKDHATGQAMASKDIGSLLNSNVLKSRELQKEHGMLKPAIFDVVKFRGEDFESMPYEHKLKVLDEIAKKYEIFDLPDLAVDPVAKEKMYAEIQMNRHPQTKEGVVEWDSYESASPTKVKFRPTYDVRISGIFQKPRSMTRGYAGGFEYDQVDGKATMKAGRVGTGLSDALRKDMQDNPEKYVGLVAAVEAQEQYKGTGVLRAPSFHSFHLDKNPRDRLAEALTK